MYSKLNKQMHFKQHFKTNFPYLSVLRADEFLEIMNNKGLLLLWLLILNIKISFEKLW